MVTAAVLLVVFARPAPAHAQGAGAASGAQTSELAK
jgi:hypothetical protein